MIVKSGFLVTFLARIAVSLRCLGLVADGLIRRAAVGSVLFVGNDLRVVIEFQAGRAEVVTKLVTDELVRYTELDALFAGLDERHPARVVHDVQGLTHEWAHALPAVDL